MANCYRVLELYSGIGGMRYAMELAGIPFEVVAAVDINPVVNEIYNFNFGKHKSMQKNIESLSVTEMENMKLDIITLSPPCQPFTRVGLKRDITDERSNSFLSILKAITELQKKPSYIMLENVKGFENSLARDELIHTLEKFDYIFQEFLLSPCTFGIPNSRLRYYIIAKLKKFGQFSFPVVKEVLHMLPNCALKYICDKCKQEANHTVNHECCLSHLLEERPNEYFDSYLVPDDVLLKYWPVLDITDATSRNTCCFTKAYTHYALGAGSVWSCCNDFQRSLVFEKVLNVEDKRKKLELLRSLSLRYFTPREIASIMCFPSTFDFPSSISEKQKYRSLGNSLNVFVVACLMRTLLDEASSVT